jgi:hypothetical protein
LSSRIPAASRGESMDFASAAGLRAPFRVDARDCTALDGGAGGTPVSEDAAAG